jgi:hypothetical protein
MGYFSNNAENEEYQDQYCWGCFHRDVDKVCVVMMAHWIFAGSSLGDVTEILDEFIPMKNGINQECTMFVPKTPHPPGDSRRE